MGLLYNLRGAGLQNVESEQVSKLWRNGLASLYNAMRGVASSRQHMKGGNRMHFDSHLIKQWKQQCQDHKGGESIVRFIMVFPQM